MPDRKDEFLARTQLISEEDSKPASYLASPLLSCHIPLRGVSARSYDQSLSGMEEAAGKGEEKTEEENQQQLVVEA